MCPAGEGLSELCSLLGRSLDPREAASSPLEALALLIGGAGFLSPTPESWTMTAVTGCI